MLRDPGFWVVVFFVACLVTVMARASRFASKVSTLPAPLPLPQLTPPPSTLRRAALRQAEHRYRMERLSQRKRARNASEIGKLKAENERLKSENVKLRHFSDGQRTGVREFLEREKQKKPITRSTVTKLLGRDTSKGYALIGEELEKLDAEAVLAVQAKASLQH